MYVSAIASVRTVRWMKSTRSSSFLSSWTTDACAIPSEACSVRDFTSSGKRSDRGRCTRCCRRKTANSGVGMPWKARTFFINALSRDSIIPTGLQPV